MYLMYMKGPDAKYPVLFPVTPGKLSLKINNQNSTINLVNEAQVNLLKSPGLTDITIDELLLPSFQRYPFAVYEKTGEFHTTDPTDGTFKSAAFFLEKLEKWKQKARPVQFILLRTTPNGQHLLWDTNMSVSIEDYEILEDAEKYGMDVGVKLSMKEYRSWGAKKLEIKKKKKTSSPKSTATKKKTRKRIKSTAKTYTVKEGDTLLNIARKQLNDDSKRKSIYILNKKTIEAAAKKHGRVSSSNGFRLYSGTELKLPN